MHVKHAEIIAKMRQGIPLVHEINTPYYYLRSAEASKIPVSEDVYYTMRELEYIEPDRNETNSKGKIIYNILRLTARYRIT